MEQMVLLILMRSKGHLLELPFGSQKMMQCVVSLHAILVGLTAQKILRIAMQVTSSFINFLSLMCLLISNQGFRILRSLIFCYVNPELIFLFPAQWFRYILFALKEENSAHQLIIIYVFPGLWSYSQLVLVLGQQLLNLFKN